MAIPRPGTNTDDVLKDARFHRASLKADPETTHLAERTEVAERNLRGKRGEAETAEDARVEAFARMLRADFALDARIRVVELEVLGSVGKDRKSDVYRASFPRGLSDLVATRGAEQQRETAALVTSLTARLPDVAARHATALAELAGRAAETEQEWLAAERASATADGEERIARTELIRALQRNEGALVELFPGNRRRVRSYYRPTRKRGAAEPGGEPVVDPAS